MVTVGGGAMGFVMALFMNAVEMRDLEYGRTKQSTRYVIRVNLGVLTFFSIERFQSNVIDEQGICSIRMSILRIWMPFRKGYK